MTRDVSDVTHRTRGLRFWEKWESWVLHREEEGWLSLASRGLVTGGTRMWGVSLYIEKPFNSKVINSVVPELRSRKWFRVSGSLCSMLFICVLWTLWMFCVPVWICLFYVFMYGYVTHCIYIKAICWLIKNRSPIFPDFLFFIFL